MLVQGGLELLMAIGAGVMAVVLPWMMQANMQHLANGPQWPTGFFWFMTVIYGIMAAAALAAGVLHIAAGVQNYRFRGKTLGIFALAGGMIRISPASVFHRDRPWRVRD